jgi:hypothetical protein
LIPFLKQWCPKYGYHGIGYVRYACASDWLAESLDSEVYAELRNAAKYNDVVQIHERQGHPPQSRKPNTRIELFLELRNKESSLFDSSESILKCHAMLGSNVIMSNPI